MGEVMSTSPIFLQIKARPSGRNATEVGESMPPTIWVWTKSLRLGLGEVSHRKEQQGDEGAEGAKEWHGSECDSLPPNGERGRKSRGLGRGAGAVVENSTGIVEKIHGASWGWNRNGAHRRRSHVCSVGGITRPSLPLGLGCLFGGFALGS